MGLLLEQFVTATKEWHRRIPQPERESRQSSVVFYAMLLSGGAAATKPLDWQDTRHLSWAEQKEKTTAELRGYYSPAQVETYLQDLFRKTQILETFFIPALVRAIEDEFARLVKGYEAGIAHNRGEIERLQAIESDPEQKAAYLRALETAHQELVAQGRLPVDAPSDGQEAIQKHIEMLEQFAQFSPEEKARREMALHLWQDVTCELLSPDNLEQARTEQFARWNRGEF